MTIVDPERLAEAGLSLDLDGAVLTVTLDKPERRNSQTPAMWHTLAAIGQALPDDVRVVVVRGAGEGFSAGIDTRLLGPAGIEGEESVLDLMHEADEEIVDGDRRLPAGVRLAGRPAVRLGGGGARLRHRGRLPARPGLRPAGRGRRRPLCMKEPSLGLVPDLAGTKPLVDCVGYSRALEICATARFVGADEARQVGLATAVVPRPELDATTADLAAALVESTGAVRETKALLQSARELDLEEQRLAERVAQVRRFRDLVGGLTDSSTPGRGRHEWDASRS